MFLILIAVLIAILIAVLRVRIPDRAGKNC